MLMIKYWHFLSFFLSFFLTLTSSPAYFRCKVFLLHLITLSDKHTHTHTYARGRIPLDEWSAWSRDCYTATHKSHRRRTTMPPRGIRNYNPSKRAAAVPKSLRPLGYRDWQMSKRLFSFVESKKFSPFPKLVWELHFAKLSSPPATTTRTK